MRELVFQTKTKINLSYFFNKYVAAHLGRQAPKLRKKRKHDFAVFANDFIGLQINVFGLYEKEELEVLFRFLQPLQAVFEKSLALDIGANIGNHTVFFSDRFLKVIAFEPHPSTYLLLHFNTRAHGNVEIFNHGLGDERGSFKMTEAESNKGGSSICISKTDLPLVDIQVEKLDNIDLKSKDVAMMKIDVEGFEYNVLMGSRKLIETSQPLLLFEQLENEFEGDLNQSIEFLKKNGYKFCWHIRENDEHKLLPKVLVNLIGFLRGRRQKIYTSKEVPRANYPMLIAVPERFQSLLGLSK